jgi:hypothetical protein
MDIISANLQDKVLSEYGLLVLLLIFAVWFLWRRNEKLVETVVKALNDNTRAFVELSTKVDNKHND